MEVSFDLRKDAQNLSLRGLSFARATDLDWQTAMVHEDQRRDYGERRFVALATLDGRLHVICFTPTRKGIRVISFRKANERERGIYEQAKALDQ